MPDAFIISEFEKTRKLAKGSRWQRYTHDTFRYSHAMAYRYLFYPLTGVSGMVTANLFWGEKMKVGLPAGTDIYLTGGRTDDAELRLTLYLLLNLKPGDQFLDIGAHYGFYSRLAVWAGAQVHAIEPSALSREILLQNSKGINGLHISPFMAGAVDELKDFYSFDPKYSEYDTVDTSQYAEQPWFQKAQQQVTKIRCITLDRFTEEQDFRPDYIKIDTEGSEADIIRGALQLLKESAPVIILEYLSTKRGNAAHRKALELLSGLGYSAYVIREDGSLEQCPEPETYLMECGRDSENLVMKKAAI